MTRTWFTEWAIGLDVSEREAVAALVTSSTLTGPVRYDIRQVETVLRPDGGSDDNLIRTVLDRFPPEIPVICVSRGRVSHRLQPDADRSSGSAPAGETSKKSGSCRIPAAPADTLKPVREAGGDILISRSGLLTADLGETRRRMASINAMAERPGSCPGAISEIDAIAASTALARPGFRLIIATDPPRQIRIAADNETVLRCRSGIPVSPDEFTVQALEEMRRIYPDRTPEIVSELPEAARAAGAAMCWLRGGASCLLHAAGDAGQESTETLPVAAIARRSALLVRSAALLLSASLLAAGIGATVSKRDEVRSLRQRLEELPPATGIDLTIPGITAHSAGFAGLFTYRYLADVADTVASTGVTLDDVRAGIGRIEMEGHAGDMTGIETFSRRLSDRLKDRGVSVAPPVTTRDGAGRMQFRLTVQWGDGR